MKLFKQSIGQNGVPIGQKRDSIGQTGSSIGQNLILWVKSVFYRSKLDSMGQI
ncbi:hypothetical protein [Bacillus litorisediminis]|uniref:hypothetical protein n=1 Tax=Bacillus litorisediminis TaxID=2922713 RepID=UPI001FAEEAEC|nr:hypothetical protein [Bacillus litorisediminis]